MKLHTRHWMIAVLIGMLLLVIATLALGGGQRSPREHEALSFAVNKILLVSSRCGLYGRPICTDHDVRSRGRRYTRNGFS